MQSVQNEELPEHPIERANIFSKLSFWYTLQFFFKGRKKTLEQKDLYRALHEHKSESLGNALCQSWQKEIKCKAGSKQQPSLLLATIRVFGREIAFLGLVLFLLEFGVRSVQPLFLNGLISFYTDGDESVHEAYLYAGAVVIFNAIHVIFNHPMKIGATHVGMKMRIAMCSMIYRKTLRLSKTALDQTTAGEILNLLSNDVGRLDLMILFVHFLWVGPLQTIFVTYLMYLEIGVSAIIGVTFLIAAIPLQIWLGKKTSVLRLRTALRTDERVRMMSEIIAGIQIIKMYAWEIPFGKMAAYARRKEMNTVRHVSYIRGVLISFIIFVTRVSIFLSLVSYVLLQQILTPQKAFVITAYYNILRVTMGEFFPLGLTQTAEALVTIKRIQKFMLNDETSVRDKSLDSLGIDNNFGKSLISEEISLNSTKKSPIINSNGILEEDAITISNLKAKCDVNSPDYTLTDVSLKVQPGTLVAVIGSVGSGKSSLLQSILGELQPESGEIKIRGTISYTSQEPWLFNGTVRQNILFGAEMNRQRYNSVVRKCALEHDFKLLPKGDKTIVGERGASLSGGQKARVTLARAVYRDTSIYLLDDPLSAVDISVGRHLFEQCIRDFLLEKTVILVTHQLQFLQHADQIVIMDKGRVSAVGRYDALRVSGLDFAQLLADQNDHNLKEEIVNENKTSDTAGCLIKRNSSIISAKSTSESITKVISSQYKEFQEEGRIGFSVYKKYFKAGGGFVMFAVMIFLCLFMQSLGSGGDYFLSYWVYNNRVEEFERSAETTDGVDTSFEAEGTRYRLLRDLGINVSDEIFDISIFTIINIATIFMTLGRSFFFFNLATRASINLHKAMFRSVIRASMFFFHTNPLGRILNRFSKDMGQVDEVLPPVMADVIQSFFSLIGTVTVISIVNPFFILPTIVLGLLSFYLREFYLKTSRDVKRLEGIGRSPIYTHTSATLTGLSTIRSFGAQKVLIQEFDKYQDLHSSSYFMFVCTSRAFGYWLDWFCVAYIGVITISFFFFSSVNGGTVGLAITQAMCMTGIVQWGMRQSAELENTMTAVERVVEYEDINSEGSLESDANQKPPQHWPEKGGIVFDKLSLRYNPDPKSNYVLNSLSFVIQPCEKIGIVGRTGAGKSSVMNALFRLSYNEGSIIIDGRDIEQMGLHDLRSKISIIPQEPMLFSGTMRYNLDPFNKYSDAKLWESLEEVKMKSVITDLPKGLHSKISEGGSNFSVGQRQLVCLARAILRKNRILVMDEATANVDPQTDALIQTTIRNKFQDCTVLTIAHRLNTVIDSDKILVMDAGRVMEFGSPYELLQREQVFFDIAKQLGSSTFENLFNIAKKVQELKSKSKSV